LGTLGGGIVCLVFIGVAGVNACKSSWTVTVAAAGIACVLCYSLFVSGSSHTSLQSQGPQTLIKQFFKISAKNVQIITQIKP
jgi:hypothetical protein